MSNTVPVTFSLEELWTLQGGVRHEQAQPWQGGWPGYSRELNDVIAEGIVFCVDEGQELATLLLSRGDLYCIDFCISKDIKDPGGKQIGRAILLKTFRARQRLAYGDQLLTDEPDDDGSTARLNIYRKATE